MDQIRTEGCIVLVKLDGERTKDCWTVVIEGGPLGKCFFHKDGDDPEAMIREGVNFYDSLIWSAGGGQKPAAPESPHA
ncbi:MAG: hypothetical protein JWM59_1488 [Verrucomicrobiales bacterium]|nr:hypothetical protein [Verrucomicrobiales bacterium]